MFFALRVGESGSVLAFEPHPESCALVLQHVQLNGMTNVEVFKTSALAAGWRDESWRARMAAGPVAPPATSESLAGSRLRDRSSAR